MSGRTSWKSAKIGLFRPFSAFFALFRRVRRAPGKSRKRRKKAFFLRYPQISLNPHLLNPHLRHSNFDSAQLFGDSGQPPKRLSSDFYGFRPRRRGGRQPRGPKIENIQFSKPWHDSHRGDGILRLFLQPEIRQFSQHFGADLFTELHREAGKIT